MGSMRAWRSPGAAIVVLSVAAPVGVAAAAVGLRGELDNTNVALALAVVVVLAAFRGGLLASGLASVSSAVAFDLWQTKPYGSLRIAGLRDTITTALLLLVGLAAGLLRERERASRGDEDAERQEFAHLQRFARLTAAGADADDLIAAAEAELSDLLGLRDCRFEPFPFDTTLPRLERQRTGWHKLVIHQHEFEPVWGPDHEVELPVELGGQQLGRFVLDSRPGAFPLLIPRHAREVAFALVDQLARALGPGWATAEWSKHNPHPVG
jgi:hypothetical protein